MNNVCIIPARGGSKRIPRKNIKDFLGKPIISYSIEIAIQSNLFDEIMVSTDDDEIAAIAVNYGASVPFMRSKKNADDYSTTVDVLIEVIDSYNKLGRQFTDGCCIYPTAPLIDINKLTEAFELMKANKYDCTFPVTPYSYPIQRALRHNNKGKIEMLYPDHETSRSQDLETIYHDAGQFYWFLIDRMMINKKLWSKNVGSVVLPEVGVQDIDTESDWKLAELKYQLLHEISH